MANQRYNIRLLSREKSMTYFLSTLVMIDVLVGMCAASACGSRTPPQPSPPAEVSHANNAPSDDPRLTSQRQAPFEVFWAEFRQAVKMADQPRLYELTRHSELHWELGDLGLERHGQYNYYYRFRDYGDFTSVYSKIFTPTIRNKILAVNPTALPNSGYEISWKDRRFTYTLLFERGTDGAYRFAGMLAGPP